MVKPFLSQCGDYELVVNFDSFFSEQKCWYMKLNLLEVHRRDLLMPSLLLETMSKVIGLL